MAPKEQRVLHASQSNEEDMSKQAEELAKRHGYEIGCRAVRSYAVYDIPTVRKGLCDNICAYLEKERGATASKAVSNAKIAVGAVCTLVGVVAHFAPIPFPENIPLLLVCIVTYYSLCGVLLWLSRVVEADTFFAARIGPRSAGPPPKNRTSGVNQNTTKASIKNLRLIASAKRLEPRITLRAELIAPRAFSLLPPKILLTAEKEYFVGTFFSEAGMVYPPAIRREVDALLTQLKL